MNGEQVPVRFATAKLQHFPRMTNILAAVPPDFVFLNVKSVAVISHEVRRMSTRNDVIIQGNAMKSFPFTAIIEKDEEGYVALCPELDISSQGATAEDAKNNLREAVELFFECASESEIEKRLLSGELVEAG